MVVVMVVLYRFVNLLPTGAPKSFPDKNFCFYEALIYAILLYTPSLLLVIIIQGKHIIFITQMRKQRLGVTISHYFCRIAIKHQSQDSTHFCEFSKARSALSVTPTVPLYTTIGSGLSATASLWLIF